MRKVSHPSSPHPPSGCVICTAQGQGVNLTHRMQTGSTSHRWRSWGQPWRELQLKEIGIGPASALSCIRPVLHPSCPAFILSCIHPVLHSSCTAYVLSCSLPVNCNVYFLSCIWICPLQQPTGNLYYIRPVLQLPCLVSDLSCIQPVLHPFCTADLRMNVVFTLKNFLSLFLPQDSA